MESVPDLTAAWHEAQAQLPLGWVLDSIRWASAGLRPEERSSDWIAVALGPDGIEERYQASDPFTALAGLAAAVRAPS